MDVTLDRSSTMPWRVQARLSKHRETILCALLSLRPAMRNRAGMADLSTDRNLPSSRTIGVNEFLGRHDDRPVW